MDRVKQTGYRHLLSVSKPFAGHDSGLEEGDILLTLNDELITHASPILHTNQAPTLSATIVRNFSVKNITITAFPHTNETDLVIYFCGALIQRPHIAVRQYVSKIYSEVYIAGYFYGSPMQRYGVAARNFITHLNGAATPDLNTFVAEARKIPDKEYFRITGLTTNQIRFVKTMKRDEHYFPMLEYRRDPEEVSGWRVMPL